MTRPPRVINNLRWWIGSALLASTVINYLDRQTLSVLAPYLKTEFTWTNSDFALLVISFRIAYAVMQTVAGRVVDILGARRGLLLSVTWYSPAALLTSLATGLRSFAFFRFLLGTGEAANWPGATKVVSEWFPKSERGWAVALFDSGSSLGGAIAPALVLWLYHTFGSWRPAFLCTGVLGFAWLLVWSKLYHPPESHPNLGERERAMLLASREQEHTTEARALTAAEDDAEAEPGSRVSWFSLLARRQTWGIILGRSLTDPVWYFVTDWFAIYLVSKGFRLENALIGFWLPFLASDLGNFFGGGLSSYLIRRGWRVLAARKFVIGVCGVGMLGLIPSVLATSLPWIVGLFAVSTFCYAAWSTMALLLPSDLYPSRAVASVSGMSGTGSGIGTIISTFLIGWTADRHSFAPVLIGASLIPLLATILVFVLVVDSKDRKHAATA